MNIIFGIGIGLAIAAGVLVLVVWTDSRHTANRLCALEQQARAMQDQLDRKAHTESTIAAMEDALAVLMRVELEEKQHALYRESWINRAQSILQSARQGPRAYPVDQPTGKRVQYRGGGR